MNVLIASAAVLTAILVGMALYIKSHPPEASAKGVFWLQRGLRLGAAFQSNRKLGYIDKKGEVIVPPSLDWGTEFVDGVAAVGLELPAAYGAGVGTGRTGHSPLEEAALAGAKKKPKKRGEPSSSSMKAD
jgi:hypothetical protein